MDRIVLATEENNVVVLLVLHLKLAKNFHASDLIFEAHRVCPVSRRRAPPDCSFVAVFDCESESFLILASIVVLKQLDLPIRQRRKIFIVILRARK